MINQNFMIASRALNANHTQKQTILVLGFMVLFSGVIIYRIYKIADKQLSEKNDLIKRNDNLNFVNANLNEANGRLNAEVLYHIEQNAAIAADKNKEAASESGAVATQIKQA